MRLVKTMLSNLLNQFKSILKWKITPLILLAIGLLISAIYIITFKQTPIENTPIGIDKNLATKLIFYKKILSTILLATLPALLAYIFQNGSKSFFATLSYCVILAIYWLISQYYTNYEALQGSSIGEKTSVISYKIGIYLVTIVILSPPFVMLIYRKFTSLMDKYLLKQFFMPFFFSFLAISALWIVFDLSDNGPDFIESGTSFTQIIWFYIVQIPWLIVEFLPITLLLGILYCFAKMSKANEIVSMLNSGRSLVRVILPLIIFALYTTFISIALNYELTPWAQKNMKSVHEDITGDGSKKNRTRYLAANFVMYNKIGKRFWYIRRIPVDLKNENFKEIMILELDEKQNIKREIYARNAKWINSIGELPPRWEFQKGIIIEYGKEITEINPFTNEKIPYTLPKYTRINGKFSFPEISDNPPYPNNETWQETPWEMVSAGIEPEFLGVPKLTSYINTHTSANLSKKLSNYKTHWHYRWSLPFRCLISVLIACPLGIVFSRRGVIGNVSIAVALYIALFFFTIITIAMGENGSIMPISSAWIVNIIFLLIAIALIFIKDKNKDLSFINPFSWFKKKY